MISVPVALAQEKPPETASEAVIPGPTPSPTPAVVAKPEQSSQSDEDESVPAYLKASPRWAFGLRLAFSDFPIKGGLGDSFQLFTDYMLPSIKVGTLSFGIHLGSFPIYAPDTGLPYPVYENYSVGAQGRFQLKFMQRQLIIPTAAVEWDYFSLKEYDTGAGQLTGSSVGVSLGAMLSMGYFDPGTARQSFEGLGMTDTYLTAEMRTANISTTLFDLSGSFWYFGIRLEFE